ncbi:MAG: four helix bundle protein [Acidobacteriota bacterium]|jgi:four helix bundle protein|nr:four helix bundle protein [Acidobacteriota bacterium]
MSKTSFENLEVYQLAEKLADEVWKVVIKWEHFAKITIGQQLVNSADSVPANIAEGNGRFNFKDNSRFVKIARGSLYETKNWLRRAYTRNLLTLDETENLKPLIEKLLPKLNAYKKSLDNLAKK